MVWRVRKTFVFWANRPRRCPGLPVPAPPGRPAPNRTWYVWVLDSSHKISYVRASGGRSRQLFSMPWRERGSVVSWANRPVDVPSCSALLCPATPPCAAPTRPARGMSRFWIRHINIFEKYIVISKYRLTRRAHNWIHCRIKPFFLVPKLIPGQALHEKGLQRQISVSTLVSSQGQRALLVPVINRT